MDFNIAVIKGDGIGPEIVTEAMQRISNYFKNNYV